MKALFIGRFQPLHKGHLKIIQTISKKYDCITIGLGSSQYNNTLENPFSSNERVKMIKYTLEENEIRNYKIVLIPDIHNPPKWVDHILSINSDFDVIITNSPLTRRLFSEKGYKVEKTIIYDRKKYSGQRIREKIINDEQWEDLVPDQVSKIIKDVDGIKRLKKLNKN